MARPLRIHVPGAMYHITLRGNHQQDIFFCDADRERLNRLFADVLNRFSGRLHAYCFMTNHIHALVQVGDVPLGRLVLRIASRYARVTQARMATTGHLFERRYYPTLVDADAYFMELLRYIHLNPVRAGLAPAPESYPWSSHHAYIGARHEEWVTTEFGLALFAPESTRAVGAYRRFVNEALADKNPKSPLEDVNPSDRRILGSDDFARRLLGERWKPRSRKSLDDLIAEACAHFNVDVVQLESRSRAARLVSARAWIAAKAVTGCIATISAVARRLNRDESSLRRAVAARGPQD
jgi:putative transposase